MISKETLADLVAQQPFFGAKIKKYGGFKDRYIYHLYAQDFESDLQFLKQCQSHKIIADIIPRNPYFEFGFKDLSIEKIQSIISVVKRISISTLFENIPEVMSGQHLESIYFSGPLFETEKHPSSSKVLDLSSLKRLNALTLPVNIYASSVVHFSENTNLKELQISHLKEGSGNPPDSLLALTKLRVLDLFRYKVVDFQPISHLTDLRLLICNYSRSLRDVSALRNLSKLERIDFENCPNLINLEVLSELPNLKVLRLNKCRKIKSLSFLKNTKVECLEFFDTALEDNDVSFLNEMRNLKVVRYTHKRTYNVPRKDDLEKLPSGAWHEYTYYRDQYLV